MTQRGEQSSAANVARAFSFASLASYSFKERFLIRAADLAFFLLIKIISGTIKIEIEGWEHFEAASSNGKIPIYAFWHNRVFLATYFWRRRAIVVMTSRSFDGEYIARFIQRFGYGAARGSSTRGATGALIEMKRLILAGFPGAFTIDGPKGPPHVAKMGAVQLAKLTGHPVLPFTVTAAKYWAVEKSWDKFQVPKPFNRACVVIAPPIFVSAGADDQELEAKRVELQSALDEVNQRGEEWRQLVNR